VHKHALDQWPHTQFSFPRDPQRKLETGEQRRGFYFLASVNAVQGRSDRAPGALPHPRR